MVRTCACRVAVSGSRLCCIDCCISEDSEIANWFCMDGNRLIAVLRPRVHLSRYGRALYLRRIGWSGIVGCGPRSEFASSLAALRSRINRRVGLVGCLLTGDTNLGLVGASASLREFVQTY